jgi:hypothetical protein
MAAEDAVQSQGTELFLSSDGTAVVKMSCPTAITGLGGAADAIDTTCLDSVEAESARGFKRPGQINVPFILLPQDASHQTILDDLDASGEVVDWTIALSDGTADPTITAGEWTQPTTRTTVAFKGYVADVNIDINTGEVVRGTLIIQRTGPKVWGWKAP